MNEFGLEPRALELIRTALHHHPKVAEAKIFGSRALGRERPNSDIDIAVWGTLDLQDLIRLHGELDELPLPYQFDVKLYDAIQYAPLREHIDRVGRLLYRAQRTDDGSSS